jgi:hypothetical protein
MFSLSDPRWESLYPGSAHPLQKAEAAIAAGCIPEETWQDLYWMFCNQGTVYLRSFAAVPHLVRFSRLVSLQVRFELLELVAGIERGRIRDAREGPLPEDWKPSYFQALAEARSSLAVCVAEGKWEFKKGLNLAGMLLALSGFAEAGFWVSRMDDWIECRSCGATLLERQQDTPDSATAADRGP